MISLALVNFPFDMPIWNVRDELHSVNALESWRLRVHQKLRVAETSASERCLCGDCSGLRFVDSIASSRTGVEIR